MSIYLQNNPHQSGDSKEEFRIITNKEAVHIQLVCVCVCVCVHLQNWMVVPALYVTVEQQCLRVTRHK